MSLLYTHHQPDQTWLQVSTGCAAEGPETNHEIDISHHRLKPKGGFCVGEQRRCWLLCAFLMSSIAIHDFYEHPYKMHTEEQYQQFGKQSMLTCLHLSIKHLWWMLGNYISKRNKITMERLVSWLLILERVNSFLVKVNLRLVNWHLNDSRVSIRGQVFQKQISPYITERSKAYCI